MTPGIPARGVIGTILVGKELTYGAIATPTLDLGLVTGGGIDADSAISESFGYGQANAVAVNSNVVHPKGSYELEIQHGRMLEFAVYGGTTTHVQEAATGDWTHTFVWSNTLPSFTAEGSAELGATDLGLKIKGLIFDNSDISLAVDGRLKMTSSWVGKDIDGSLSAATAAVVDTGAPLRGFAGTLKLGGTAADYVQSWGITVNRNVKALDAQGQRTPAYAASNTTNVSWKATIGFSETTQLARLLGSSSAITAAQPAVFTAEFIADNGVTIGSGKRKFDMAMTGCQVKGWSKKYNIEGFEMYDITGSGLLGTTTFVDQITSTAWPAPTPP